MNFGDNYNFAVTFSTSSPEVIKQAAASVDRLADAQDKAAAASKRLNPAMDGAARGFRNAGNAALNFSRGFEDFMVAGIPGAVNNVEMLTMSLGGTAGLAAGLTLAAVAVNTLYRNWDTLIAGLDPADIKPFVGELDKLKQAVEKLEQKKLKIAVETEQLDRAREKLDALTKAQAAYDAMVGKPTSEQRARADAFNAAAEGLPGGTASLNSALGKSIIDEMRANNQTLARLTAELDEARRIDRIVKNNESYLEVRDAERAVANHEAELRQFAKGERARMLGNASLGDAGHIQAIVNRMDRAGRGDMADALRVATPGAMRAAATAAATEEEEADAREQERARAESDERRRTASERMAKSFRGLSELDADFGRDLDQKIERDADREAERADTAMGRRAGEIGDAAGLLPQLAAGADPGRMADQVFQGLMASGMGMAEAFELAGRSVAGAQANLARLSEENAAAQIMALEAHGRAIQEATRAAHEARARAEQAMGLGAGWARQNRGRALNGLGAFP